MPRFPPHHIEASWLGEMQASKLLNYAVSKEYQFRLPKVGNHKMYRSDALIRRSRVLTDLGPFTECLRDSALAMQSKLEAKFGMDQVKTANMQLELSAHCDGDFYEEHIDTFTGAQHSVGEMRRLSLVYYIHSRPQRFEGGRLRLFDLTGTETIALAPHHDVLVAFPSFARHDVERVVCPNSRFADARFAVNIWLCA